MPSITIFGQTVNAITQTGTSTELYFVSSWPWTVSIARDPSQSLVYGELRNVNNSLVYLSNTFTTSQACASDIENYAKSQSSSTPNLIELLLASDPGLPTNNYANTYTGTLVTNETWKRADTTNQKTIDYTYTNGRVTQEVRKVYAENGATILGQLTIVYTYTGNRVSYVLTRNI